MLPMSTGPNFPSTRFLPVDVLTEYGKTLWHIHTFYLEHYYEELVMKIDMSCLIVKIREDGKVFIKYERVLFVMYWSRVTSYSYSLRQESTIMILPETVDGVYSSAAIVAEYLKIYTLFKRHNSTLPLNLSKLNIDHVDKVDVGLFYILAMGNSEATRNHKEGRKFLKGDVVTFPTAMVVTAFSQLGKFSLSISKEWMLYAITADYHRHMVNMLDLSEPKHSNMLSIEYTIWKFDTLELFRRKMSYGHTHMGKKLRVPSYKVTDCVEVFGVYDLETLGIPGEGGMSQSPYAAVAVIEGMGLNCTIGAGCEMDMLLWIINTQVENFQEWLMLTAIPSPEEMERCEELLGKKFSLKDLFPLTGTFNSAMVQDKELHDKSTLYPSLDDPHLDYSVKAKLLSFWTETLYEPQRTTKLYMWAHNASSFDSLLLLPHICTFVGSTGFLFKVKIILKDGKAYSVTIFSKVYGLQIIFLCSQLLLPGKLSKLAASFSLPTGKASMPHEVVSGGVALDLSLSYVINNYASLSNNRLPQNFDWTALKSDCMGWFGNSWMRMSLGNYALLYCILDVLVLYQVLTSFMGEMHSISSDHYQTSFSAYMTMSKLAQISWYRESGYDIPLAMISKDDYELFNVGRSSYMGGKTEVYKGKLDSGTKCYYFDYSGMYSRCMELTLPYSAPYMCEFSVVGKKEVHRFIKAMREDGHLFFAKCVWESSSLDNHPCLAMIGNVSSSEATLNVGGKLLFATGKGSGYYFSKELEMSIDSGYEIQILTHIVAFKGSTWLKEYIMEISGKKLEAKVAGNRSKELIYKNMANFLYGKFGMIIEDCGDLVFVDEDKESSHDITSYKHLAGAENWFYVSKKDPENIAWGGSGGGQNIFISSAIAAYGRIILHKGMMSILVHNKEAQIMYCDTDSYFVQSPVEMKPYILVDFKEWASPIYWETLEVYDEGYFVFPKMYMIVKELENIVKIKGMNPKGGFDGAIFTMFKTLQFSGYLDGNTTWVRSSLGSITIREQSKKLRNDWSNTKRKYVLDVSGDWTGYTTPYTAEEITKSVSAIKPSKSKQSEILKSDEFSKKDFVDSLKALSLSKSDDDVVSVKVADLEMTLSQKFSSSSYKAYSSDLTSMDLNFRALHGMLGYIMAQEGFEQVRLMLYVKATDQWSALTKPSLLIDDIFSMSGRQLGLLLKPTLQSAVTSYSALIVDDLGTEKNEMQLFAIFSPFERKSRKELIQWTWMRYVTSDDDKSLFEWLYAMKHPKDYVLGEDWAYLKDWVEPPMFSNIKDSECKWKDTVWDLLD